jgi:hypothetical protein
MGVMSIDLDMWDGIVDKHPEILMTSGYYQGEKVPMTPGTGIGWYSLIDQLCTRLEATPKPWPMCSDIKVDRGGQLCFYVDSATDDQYEIIEMAESLCHEICQGCGAIKAPEVSCC